MKKPAANAALAVAYIRRSTLLQDLSPEAQRAAINAWATRANVTIDSWHEDDVSGGDDIEDCPKLLLALDAVRVSGAGVLVVAKRDRLHRDTLKAGMLHAIVAQSGASIVSAAGEGNGNDPTDVLLRGIIDLFAQHERLMIRARTKAALGVKKARKERTGAVPLGFRAEATGPIQVKNGVSRNTAMLVPDESEQATIAAARELRATGLSLRAVAAELLARGHKPRKGATFKAETIARMCRASEAA